MKHLRILLAEDNNVNQIVASRLLEKRGHTVFIAENGEQAVSFFETEKLDIIFMDLQMPIMDGFAATLAIRSSQDGINRADIPIIAMTAHARSEDRDACLKAGMSDYLSKPIEPEAIESVLETYQYLS